MADKLSLSSSTTNMRKGEKSNRSAVILGNRFSGTFLL
jgi:hypothetical protein